jgi:YHS domain-containing protein
MIHIEYKLNNRIFFLIVLAVICGCVKKETDTNKVETTNNFKLDSVMFQDSAALDSMVQSDTIPLSDTLPYFADYKGYRYYFACGPCRDRFLRNAEQYLRLKKKYKGRVRKRKL